MLTCCKYSSSKRFGSLSTVSEPEHKTAAQHTHTSHCWTSNKSVVSVSGRLPVAGIDQHSVQLPSRLLQMEALVHDPLSNCCHIFNTAEAGLAAGSLQVEG